MKTSITIVILVIVVAVATTGIVTTLATQMAQAEPKGGHGDCKRTNGNLHCVGDKDRGLMANKGQQKCINNGPWASCD